MTSSAARELLSKFEDVIDDLERKLSEESARAARLEDQLNEACDDLAEARRRIAELEGREERT